MEISGDKRIKLIEFKYKNLTEREQVSLSMIFTKRLLRLCHESLIEDNINNMVKIENIFSVINDFLFRQTENKYHINKALEESKTIYIGKESNVNSHAVSVASNLEMMLSNIMKDNNNYVDGLINYIDSIDLLVHDQIEEENVAIGDKKQLEQSVIDHQTMKRELSFLEDVIQFIEIHPIQNSQNLIDIEDIFVLNQTIIRDDEE